ncbi:MAG: hypothetical protein HY795_04425 [Desulfovibrio sp.]|nr:hypothetical protein [Desulfovibrio sp.]MBI4960418.1 hypothetical protein [Desulfovibrio sp.]
MASENISFDTLPASIRKPGKYFEFNTRLAVRTLPTNEQRVLILAQASPDAEQATLTPVSVYSDEEASRLFGPGSQAHLMTRAAITANAYLRLTVVGLPDDAAGIAASCTATVTGTSAGLGVAGITIGSQTVQISVSLGVSAAAIAQALADKVNAHPSLPVTASAAGGVITLTARNKGAAGNQIPVAANSAVDGVSIAITAMANGAVDPDMTQALSVVFADGHNIIVTPYGTQAALTTLRQHLDAVSHALEQRGAIGVCASTGTLAAAVTLAGQINAGRIGKVASMPDVFGKFASLSNFSDLLPRFSLNADGQNKAYTMTPAAYSGTPVSGPLTGAAEARPVVVVPSTSEASQVSSPDMSTPSGQGRAMAAATLNLASAMAVANATSNVLAAEVQAPTLTPAEVEAAVGVSRQRLQDCIADQRTLFPTHQAYPIIEELRTSALAVQDMGAQVIRLHPPLVVQTAPSSCNLHLLAHWLYGDYTRATELSRLNPGVRNPNFVASGQELYGYAK